MKLLLKTGDLKLPMPCLQGMLQSFGGDYGYPNNNLVGKDKAFFLKRRAKNDYYLFF